MNDMSNTSRPREWLTAELHKPAVTDEQLRSIIANLKTGYRGCSPAETVEVAKIVLAEREAARGSPIISAHLAMQKGAAAVAAPAPLRWSPQNAPASKPEHKKVVVTFAQDSKARGAKHYAVQPDGSIAKVAHSTSAGKLLVLETTVADTATIARPDMYVICSVLKGKPADGSALLDYGWKAPAQR
jgi:hypothetical protein